MAVKTVSNGRWASSTGGLYSNRGNSSPRASAPPMINR